MICREILIDRINRINRITPEVSPQISLWLPRSSVGANLVPTEEGSRPLERHNGIPTLERHCH